MQVTYYVFSRNIVGTIEWELWERLLYSDNLIYMVSLEKINTDITMILMGRFYLAYFYRLNEEIVERWFSLQNSIFYGVEIFNSPFYTPRTDTSL